MKAVILTGGAPPTKSELENCLADADMLIGADSAADVLCEFGIVPDVLIGDFDSAEQRSVETLADRGSKIARLETRKNETDTQAALDYALSKGAKQIVILGAFGSRFDHTLANVGMLVRAHRAGAMAKIVDAHNELVVTDKEMTLYGTPGQTVSILPLTADISVCAQGLDYPLSDLKLPFGSSRGVSNVMTGSQALIEISGGCALIIKTFGDI